MEHILELKEDEEEVDGIVLEGVSDQVSLHYIVFKIGLVSVMPIISFLSVDASSIPYKYSLTFSIKEIKFQNYYMEKSRSIIFKVDTLVTRI